MGREGLSFLFSWDWLTNDDSLTPPSACGLRSQIMSTESTSTIGFPSIPLMESGHSLLSSTGPVVKERSEIESMLEE